MIMVMMIILRHDHRCESWCHDITHRIIMMGSPTVALSDGEKSIIDDHNDFKHGSEDESLTGFNLLNKFIDFK